GRGLLAWSAMPLLAIGGFLLYDATRASLRARSDELAQTRADFEEFLRVASHDLQEPLRAISGFASLLARRSRGKLDAQGEEGLDHGEAGARRGGDLLKALPEYPRAGRGSGPIAPSPAARALDAALQRLAPELEEAKPRIDREPLPDVVADETQLAQLFGHLI